MRTFSERSTVKSVKSIQTASLSHRPIPGHTCLHELVCYSLPVRPPSLSGRQAGLYVRWTLKRYYSVQAPAMHRSGLCILWARPSRAFEAVIDLGG